MPMRTDCQHYESRTYGHGETVRKCNLDLAPEAPWRCPDGCPSFRRRMVDAGWDWGSLADAQSTAPPDPPGLGQGVAELLDEAEDIINAVGPQVLAEFEAEQRRPGRFKRLWRKRDR